MGCATCLLHEIGHRRVVLRLVDERKSAILLKLSEGRKNLEG